METMSIPTPLMAIMYNLYYIRSILAAQTQQF